jgi:hypothetical protein
MALCSAPARADIDTFVTPTGATTSGGPVNAEAVFTTGAGTITITLTNLQANPKDVAQAISDLSFTVSAGSNLTLSSATNPTVNLINIVNHVGVPDGTGVAGFAYSSTATTGLFEQLGSGTGPAQLIIGPGPYTNANGSINNNKPHNPFIDQTVTWTDFASGVTASTKITAATFSFGTTLGANLVPGVPATPVGVPEPSTMALAALGTMGFLAYGLRCRLKKRTRQGSHWPSS